MYVCLLVLHPILAASPAEVVHLCSCSLGEMLELLFSVVDLQREREREIQSKSLLLGAWSSEVQSSLRIVAHFEKFRLLQHVALVSPQVRVHAPAETEKNNK